MPGKQTPKANGVTIQIETEKPGPGKGHPKGARWKKGKGGKEIKIIEDIDEEVSSIPLTQLQPGKGARGSLGASDDQHIQIPVGSRLAERKESLTVPHMLPGSSDIVDDPTRGRTNSLSLGRESSKLSLESRRSIDIRAHNDALQRQAPEEKPKSLVTPEQSWIQSAIPFLPLGPAVVCLVMNIVLPGSGTILSGFSIFCCGQSRMSVKKEEDLIVSLCVNVWVGLAQLFTVTFLFVGWFWSLAWGIKMVILAAERRSTLKAQRAKDLQTLALSAFGSNKQMKPMLT